MSDILIRGMEMPASCADCPIKGDSDCKLTRQKVKYYHEDRRDDCPLVELPPHGDLIDRDALLSRGKNNPFVDSEIYHPCVQTNCREIVMDEPVIVPAERREE